MNRPPVLFACSKCFSRHPFEDLSSGQQLCKKCQNVTPVVKCTYCRSEFEQLERSQQACKKCDYNLKSYGKPKMCEYCNIVAAFVGNKCQRCMSSEAKYGPPTICDQCKLKSAFERHESSRKKGDAKQLCWLCLSSYRRVLEKSKQIENERRSKSSKSVAANENRHSKTAQSAASSSSSSSTTTTTGTTSTATANNKRTYDKILNEDKSLSPTLSGIIKDEFSESNDSLSLSTATTSSFSKVPRNASSSNKSEMDIINNTESFVTISQLKDKISFLQKQLVQKDQQLLTKDRQITELKAKHFTMETELKNKMRQTSREHEATVEHMNAQIQNLLKKVATLSKSTKRSNANSNVDKFPLTVARETNNNSGSSTDSPVLN